MARTALIIGGSGQIGQATRLALRADGWTVTCAQRAAAPGDEASVILMDRDAPGAVAKAVGAGVDALIDTVAFDANHAGQLLEVRKDVGALVVISSASVYRDGRGRTLDEAAEGGFPRFPEPIAEDQPTVAPGPSTYSTRKAALETILRDGAAAPLAILRPGAIHGPGSRHPREWFFVRRILDGRPAVPLAFDGKSRFHTTATANIAQLIRVLLAAPATAVLNIADPQALSVGEIGQAIVQAVGARLEMVPFPGPPRGGVGASPWSIPHPIVLDTTAARALGYRPVVTYAEAVGGACRSAKVAKGAGVSFPAYLEALFDYPAEDAFLAGEVGGTP